MFLLDTNILSELTKKKSDPGVTRRILSTRSDLLFASELTRYELRYGAALDDRRDQLWKEIEERILPVPTWIPVDRDVAWTTADLDAALSRQGKSIESIDAMIAGTALAFGLILVTRNVRHFANVPRLALENWFPEGVSGT